MKTLFLLFITFPVAAMASCPAYFQMVNHIKDGDAGLVYETVNKSLSQKNYQNTGNIKKVAAVFTLTVSAEMIENEFKFKTILKQQELNGKKSTAIGENQNLRTSIASAFEKIEACREL